jgi:hypothetical protein
MLVGGLDQAQFKGLDIRNFEEKRDREFSLDRLGRSGVEKSVVGYLRLRAIAAGTRFKSPKQFSGWAVLRARQLEQPQAGLDIYGRLPVVASPVHGEGLSENIYHAHIVTPEADHYAISLHLRHLFANYGTTEVPPIEEDSNPPALGVAKVFDWFFNLLRRK